VEAKGPKAHSLFGTPNNQRRLGLNNPVLPNIREPVGAGIPPKGASTLKGLGAGVVVESLNDSPPLIPRLLSGVEGPPSSPPILSQSHRPLGGRLSNYWEEWNKIGADKWVLKTLKEGYRIPFSSLPTLTITPEIRIQYMQDPVRRKLLASAIKEMEEKAAIETVSSPDPGFYSQIFLVPKPGNKWIIDLSALNSHIPCQTFKMETPGSTPGSVQKGQWLTSLDLKDAYFHVPIHPESRRYLRFLHQGIVWQFKALPFGLNTAPGFLPRLRPP